MKHRTSTVGKGPKFYATSNDDIASQMAFKENHVSEEVAGYVNHTAGAGYDNGSNGISWGDGGDQSHLGDHDTLTEIMKGR